MVKPVGGRYEGLVMRDSVIDGWPSHYLTAVITHHQCMSPLMILVLLLPLPSSVNPLSCLYFTQHSLYWREGQDLTLSSRSGESRPALCFFRFSTVGVPLEGWHQSCWDGMVTSNRL